MSMEIKHAIKCDFQRPGVRPTVHAKENDMATRFVVCEFFDDGEPYAVSPTATCVVKYAKSDGTSGVYDTIDTDTERERTACVFSENYHKATIELAPNILIGFGLVRIDLSFVGTDEILSTFTFNVQVERSVTDGTRADDYFSYRALDELYNAVDEANANAAEALAAGLHDITAEYIAAKASRPTLTVDTFLLEQEDGLYRINVDNGYNPYTARVVTDSFGKTHMDVVEYSQADRVERNYIDSTLITTVAMNAQDGAVTINPETLMGDLETAKSNIATISLQIENLIAAGDGNIYSKIVDSSTAYSKYIPINSLPNVVLDSLGGDVTNIVVSGRNLSTVDHVSHPAGQFVGDKTITFDLPYGTYTISIDVSDVSSYGAQAAAILRYNVEGESAGYLSKNAQSAVVNGKLTSINVYGTNAYARYVGTLKLMVQRGSTASPYAPHVSDITIPIPTAIRGLPGYGLSDGDIYNEVDFSNRRYIQRVTLSGGEVVELPEPLYTDISSILPKIFNVLHVEGGGAIVFQQTNGATLPVPSTITFPVKIGGNA